MPTALSSGLIVDAAQVGAALPEGPRRVRVHSVYSAAINVLVDGLDYLACITGPRGLRMPNAIALDWEGDFRDWPLARGAGGLLADECLELGARGPGADGPRILVRLSSAARGRRDEAPRIESLGKAFEAAVDVLARTQVQLDCDLRIGALLGRDAATTALGERLAAAALALADSTATIARAEGRATGSLGAAVAGLVGLGKGLTPSGDDFLCGFLFAARCSSSDGGGRAGGAIRRSPVAEALGPEIVSRLNATSDIGASFLRCAALGYFVGELHEAAAAIAAEDAAGADEAMRRLCEMGHSSGADSGTGFLLGLASLLETDDGPGR